VIDWLQALVLGVVQGLTEFLPISSTAHVLIVSQVFGWQDPGAAFTAVTQIGTEVAVLIYFRREIGEIVRSLIQWFTVPASRGTSEARMAWAVVWGSLPIGVFGFVFQDFIVSDARSLTLVACTLIVFGIILMVAEHFPVRRNTGLSPGTAVTMGFAQALALIPGVSRSGATISAGLLAGAERTVVTRYAFLLAVPAVMGSGLYEALSISEGPVAWGPTLLATCIAALIGFAVISGLLKFLQNHSFTVFGLYRVILGTGLLLAIAWGWL
jgi:undecaprenyl-diphosphatase